jgi:hypothetical protein
MSRPRLVRLATLLLAPSTALAQPAAPDPARERRLAWFREAKFGLFIHWGLYAAPASMVPKPIDQWMRRLMVIDWPGWTLLQDR